MTPRDTLLLIFLAALPACSAPPCPIIANKEWTADEQRQILAEEKKLAPDSVLIGVLEDYARLRAEVRR